MSCSRSPRCNDMSRPIFISISTAFLLCQLWLPNGCNSCWLVQIGTSLFRLCSHCTLFLCCSTADVFYNFSAVNCNCRRAYATAVFIWCQSLQQSQPPDNTLVHNLQHWCICRKKLHMEILQILYALRQDIDQKRPIFLFLHISFMLIRTQSARNTLHVFHAGLLW